MHILSQCYQVVSVFGFSLGFSRLFLFSLFSLASGFRFLIFGFHSISFAFSFLWVHFRTVSSWAISCFDSSGSFANWATWTFFAPCHWLLTLGPCIFASYGDVLPWQRLNLGKPALCGFILVDLDRNPVPAITIPMAQTTDFRLSQTQCVW